MGFVLAMPKPEWLLDMLNKVSELDTPSKVLALGKVNTEPELDRRYKPGTPYRAPVLGKRCREQPLGTHCKLCTGLEWDTHCRRRKEPGSGKDYKRCKLDRPHTGFGSDRRCTEFGLDAGVVWDRRCKERLWGMVNKALELGTRRKHCMEPGLKPEAGLGMEDMAPA